jgi:hypothetical protein
MTDVVTDSLPADFVGIGQNATSIGLRQARKSNADYSSTTSFARRVKICLAGKFSSALASAIT